MPNNITLGTHRLISTERTLQKKGLMKEYDAEIRKLLNKKYAEPVPNTDPDHDKILYLPHHAVLKKAGKLRVVFDCASRFHNVSLNDRCLQGPDLNTKLLHIMFRFRQHHYAIMADIESMYHQVKIPVHDRDVLRFLWRNEDGDIKRYRMTSHIFGGIWCASSATYALQQTAEHSSYPTTIRNLVTSSFYVDDLLVSVRSTDDPQLLMDNTLAMLQQGGFNLTKFVINDANILQEIPEYLRAK